MENLSVAMGHRGRMALRLLGRACMVLALLAGWQGAAAQSTDRSGALERQVKAAYLHKFASYVDWPDGTFSRSDSALVIGVIGADGLADELEKIVAGRSVNGRTMTVRKLRRGETPSGLHILFIGQIDKGALAEILAATRGQPLLTVTESEEAYALGSMINFVVAEDKLRFEVALKPVGLSHLKISARMLSAAYKVAPGAS